MKKLSPSVKIYIGIILFLVLLTVIASLRSHLQFLSFAGRPFSITELLSSHFLQPLGLTMVNIAIIAGLGFVGLVLSSKVGFAELWNKSAPNRQRFLTPALVGIGIGVFLIIVDLTVSRFFDFERVYARQFPNSILSALNTGITYELVFRLFFITFFVWVVSSFIVKNRWPNPVFWIIAVLSACACIYSTVYPIIAVYQITDRELPVAYVIENILLAGLVSMYAAYYLRKAGFLAAAGVNIWANVVLRVIWESLIIAP